MSNLALGKLPLEKEWKRPEEATDGNISKYTTKEGFSSTAWPCSFTIDLGKNESVLLVRFLLWDGLGQENINKDRRKYKFSLSISDDGEHFNTIYSNKNEEGDNGWFSFKFINEIYARFIRLDGISNSVNKDFHIVEFEVHDNTPLPLDSNNVTSYVFDPAGDKKTSDLIKKEIALKNAELNVLEEKAKSFDRLFRDATEFSDNVEILKKTGTFSSESEINNRRSKKWLLGSVAFLLILMFLIFYSVFLDNQPRKIILDAKIENETGMVISGSIVNDSNLTKDNSIDADILGQKIPREYINILLFAYYLTKVLLVSVLVFLLNWCLKNYRSEKHNYIINKHKAMTLSVVTAMYNGKDFVDFDKKDLLNKGVDTIFSHQQTGFSEKDNSSSDIGFIQNVTSGLGDIIPKK